MPLITMRALDKRLNLQGNFSFDLPLSGRGGYPVLLDVGRGHRGIYEDTVSRV